MEPQTTPYNKYRRSLVKKLPATPEELVNRLFQITDEGNFSKKFFDALFRSLQIPKTAFIDEIRHDELLTAVFIKHFYTDHAIINFSEVTLLAHILLFSLDLSSNEMVGKIRAKIGAKSIWELHTMKDTQMHKVIANLVEKVTADKVRGLLDTINVWYESVMEIVEKK